MPGTEYEFVTELRQSRASSPGIVDRTMPRPPRDTAAGLFHIYTHCVWVTPELYRDDVDRLEFLRHLALVSSRPGWTCIAFCLMGSH